MPDMICAVRGSATLARTTRDRNGNEISRKEASFEPEDNGSCIAVFRMDAETKEIKGAAELFGDWQTADYLEKIAELLGNGRQSNVPDLRRIIASAARDGFDLCDYCHELRDCNACAVQEWKSEEE